MKAATFSQIHTHINHCSEDALKQLKKILSSHLLFHFFMLSSIGLEFLMIACLYIYYPRSAYLAMSISVLIFSFFSYIIFCYYLNAKKPEQLASLKSTLIEESLKNLSPTINQDKILQKTIFSFIHDIETKSNIWKPFGRVSFINNQIDFFIGKDLHLLQEFLLLTVIDSQTLLIKEKPLDIQAHTSLAKTYIAMSKIYKNPQIIALFKTSLQEAYNYKFKALMKLAIEELKIIKRLSPNDPWVHAQLAFCYRNLEMKKEELYEYEKLNELRPGDENILLHLGYLYLGINRHADALIIYEKLFHFHPQKAKELMEKYNLAAMKIFDSYLSE